MGVCVGAVGRVLVLVGVVVGDMGGLCGWLCGVCANKNRVPELGETGRGSCLSHHKVARHAGIVARLSAGLPFP